MLAAPPFLSGFALPLGAIDPGVHVVRVVRPVVDRRAHQMLSDSAGLGDERDHLVRAELPLRRASAPHRADHLPDVGTADEAGTPACGAVPEDDERMVLAAKR